jgi:hypothetical protein
LQAYLEFFQSTMKLILILAFAFAASAMPEDRFKRDIQGIRDSCPGRCVMQDKYREWFTQMLPKAREFGKQLAEGDSQPVVPTLHPEKWDQYCTEIEAIKTCIGNCNDPGDAEKKTKAEAVLNAGKDIVCDTEIKGKFPCLQEVAKVPSPTCNEQCNQYKAPIMEAYNQYKQTGTRDWDRAKNAGKNVCLLINCRLKCRKADIETKCGADGYAAAKKLVKELAVLGQTTHAQFRPAQNFPDECKPDAVVQGA